MKIWWMWMRVFRQRVIMRRDGVGMVVSRAFSGLDEAMIFLAFVCSFVRGIAFGVMSFGWSF